MRGGGGAGKEGWDIDRRVCMPFVAHAAAPRANPWVARQVSQPLPSFFWEKPLRRRHRVTTVRPGPLVSRLNSEWSSKCLPSMLAYPSADHQAHLRRCSHPPCHRHPRARTPSLSVPTCRADPRYSLSSPVLAPSRRLRPRHPAPPSACHPAPPTARPSSCPSRRTRPRVRPADPRIAALVVHRVPAECIALCAVHTASNAR